MIYYKIIKNVIFLSIIITTISCKFNNKYIFYYNNNDAILFEENKWYSIIDGSQNIVYRERCETEGPYDIIRIIDIKKKYPYDMFVEYYKIALPERPYKICEIDSIKLKKSLKDSMVFTMQTYWFPKMIYDCKEEKRL
jgi:hypothetical protein